MLSNNFALRSPLCDLGFVALSGSFIRWVHSILFTNDSIISFQNNNKELEKLKLKNIKKGKGYINSTGKMIKQEMDFSKKNYISIIDLHRIMKILFFPKKFKEEERFNLTNEQREIIYFWYDILFL